MLTWYNALHALGYNPFLDRLSLDAVVAIGDNVARSSRCCKYSALAAPKKSAIECSQSAVANASIWWRFITFGREIAANVRVGGGGHGTARCSLRASRIEDEDEEEDKIEDSDWR